MARATPDATSMRRCIGSATFGIEPHEALASEFPIQPSGKDRLGRMCKSHWNQYTNALRRASLARKAEAAGTVEIVTTAPAKKATAGKGRKAPKPEPIKVAPPRKRREPKAPMAHVGSRAEASAEVAQEPAAE